MGEVTSAILDEGMRMGAWSLRLGAAAIFLEAGFHALGDRATFAGAVAAYRIIPARLAPVAALAVPVLQIAAAMALMMPRLARPGGVLAVVLVLAFTAAIMINLRRGRTDIDCGCGGGAEQKISPALVVRNLLLAVCLVFTVAAPSHLVFALPVFVGVAGFGVFLTGLYFAANQLISNAQAFSARPKGFPA